MISFDSYISITALVAFFIDMLIGDPRSKYHPVVLMGNLISLLEGLLYRLSDSNSSKILKTITAERHSRIIRNKIDTKEDRSQEANRVSSPIIPYINS